MGNDWDSGVLRPFIEVATRSRSQEDARRYWCAVTIAIAKIAATNSG